MTSRWCEPAGPVWWARTLLTAVRVGTSGYAYPHWIGRFYPEDLPGDRWLSFYAASFDTVELNVTFYRTPKPDRFRAWARMTPRGFHFALKGSRYITHIRRLRDPADSVRVFFDAAAPLGTKCRVVLWQLPPRFRVDPERLGRFFDEIADRQKAQRHRVRCAFEFRDRSWLQEDVYALLRAHDAALVLADWPVQMATEELEPYETGRPRVDVPLTASWVYLRRHGPGGRYGSAYRDQHLARDAAAIMAWTRQGKDVCVFFNNDARAYAVANAARLKEMIGAPALRAG